MRRSSLATLVAAGVLLTACASGGTGDAPSSTAGPGTPSSAAPARPQPCGPGARAFWLPGPDGTKLEANAFGSGRVAAVFLHQAGTLSDMCGFWPFARWLATERHVLVVLVNRCTYGNSTCQLFQRGDAGAVSQTEPAVDWARRHGARRVTLVGASAGGGDALQAAGLLPEVAAVVDLSGDATDTGTGNLANARRVHVPALFAVAPDDRYCDIEAMRAAYRATPGTPKRLLVVRNAPGDHGWDLLYDIETRRFTPLARVVVDWVVGHTG